jgi:hypothetical protein
MGVIQPGADPGEAHLLVKADVGGAAHYLQLASTGVYAAQAQPVRLGVRPEGRHLADKTLVPTPNLYDLADLDSSHGQPVGQLPHRHVQVNVLSQPG